MNAIETVSLTKFYGKSRGINDIDLTVAEGDFFGFIGPNGAGKSTTIRILTGLISQTSGEAKIFGKDAENGRSRRYRLYAVRSEFLSRNESPRGHKILSRIKKA